MDPRRAVAPAIVDGADLEALERFAAELHLQAVEAQRAKAEAELYLRAIETQLNQAEIVYSHEYVGSGGARSKSRQTGTAMRRALDGARATARGGVDRLC